MRKLLIAAAVLAAVPCILAYAQRDPGAQPRTDAASPSSQPQHGMKTESSEHAESPIEAEEFVETATAKGIAEIETAKLALERGTQKIHEFANKMITDHTQANERLAEIARQQNLEVADNATLIDRAQALMLRLSDGKSFDEAYIDNQVTAHEDTIMLFQRAANSSLGEFSSFAEKTAPKLEEHLRMARELNESLQDNPRTD